MSEPKVIVITGASDGIGAAAARQLTQRGHHVVVVGRSPDKTQRVAQNIGASKFFVADFGRFEDVRRLASDLDAAYPRIDVLANNAGGIFGGEAKTVDGFETTFQVNHLSPFLLTRLLLDKLTASRASVLQTSSTAARLLAGRIKDGDLDGEQHHDPMRAYGVAKLSNILFTTELHRRYHTAGLSAAAFHPGNVATGFGSQTTSALMKAITTNPVARRLFMITPEKGADQLVWLATGDPGVEWTSGRYYQRRKPAKTHAQAFDNELAQNLWEHSEALVNR